MRIQKYIVGMLAMGIIFVLSSYAGGAIIRFSLDGENEAPETLNVMAGDVLTMYIISFSPGEPYWQEFSWYPENIVEEIWVYSAAGDLATATRTNESSGYIEAEDHLGNILEGKHFGFEVRVPSSMELGESLYVGINSYVLSDSMRFDVVPEPASAVMMGIGAVLLAVRRKRR